MLMFLLGAITGTCMGITYMCLLVVNQPDDWKDENRR